MSKYINDLMAYEKWRHDGQPPRKRMKRFQITEISAVDAPAQEGAVATITKRREPDPSATERAAAALMRQTDKLAEKWGRNDTAEALALAEVGEEMMDEEDPDRVELEAIQEAGRERFMNRPSTRRSMARQQQENRMTTKQHFKELAKATKQDVEFAKKAQAFDKALVERTNKYREEGVFRPGQTALQELRDEDPDGFECHQAWADGNPTGSEQAAVDNYNKAAQAHHDVATKVEQAIAKVQSRDGCDNRTAAQRARAENPALFDEWQNA